MVCPGRHQHIEGRKLYLFLLFRIHSEQNFIIQFISCPGILADRVIFYFGFWIFHNRHKTIAIQSVRY